MEIISPKAYKAPAHGVPRVLIVDDEVEHAEICAALLRRRGYQVVVAITGSDAFELARSLQPDLILLDLHMPVVDGFSTAANLHDHADTRHVPIVLLSACGEDLTERLKPLGVLGCLAKPFRAAQLIDCVERALEPRTRS
jgi:two-component system alkaline phosphatase synthesis response regulator PhoP